MELLLPLSYPVFSQHIIDKLVTKRYKQIEIEVLFQSGWMVETTKYVHIKSTKVYAPRRNSDSPQPPTRWLVCPLPPVSGGRGTLAGEKGVGRVPIPTRGIHCGTLYMYVLRG